MNREYKIYYHFFAILLLSYFVLFLKLGSFNMRWWDESIFAVNTYEMLQNGKYFSSYFDGVVDIYNTKPPLTNWIQLFFVKMFGYNELSLRLPSAIAASITVLFVFSFIAKTFNYTWAWLSALILLTSSGFINFHTARTADSDSLLTLFLLIGNISFIKFILYNKKRDVFIFFLFISLAFSTKLHAALLFIPAYVIVLLQQKKMKSFTLNWAFGVGIIVFLFSSFGLMFLREIDSPNYIREVLARESNRFLTVVDNHRENTSFYFDNLFKSRFSTWSMFFMVGSLFIFYIRDKMKKTILFYFLLLVITYLAIITIVSSKLEWYDMPIYPYLSIIAAYPILLLFQKSRINENPIPIKLMILFIVIIFSYPYYIMFNKSQGNTIKNGEKILEANERYLFKKIKENKNLNNVKVYYNGYKGSLLFYKYKLAENSQKIELVNTFSFQSKDKVLVSNDSLFNLLVDNFNLSIIDTYEKAQLILLDKKTSQF